MCRRLPPRELGGRGRWRAPSFWPGDRAARSGRRARAVIHRVREGGGRNAESPVTWTGLSVFLQSGRRDLNPRRPPWQGGTLPLSYSRGKRGIRTFRRALCQASPSDFFAALGSCLNSSRPGARTARLAARSAEARRRGRASFQPSQGSSVLSREGDSRRSCVRAWSRRRP
jgi:hypothetical protein